jgi:diguanylate cyclase (GGDEF)-like protein
MTEVIAEDEVTRLRQELAAREREVKALRRVALAMNASLELGKLLETIVDVALELTGAQRAYVVWRDEQELDRLLAQPVRGGSWRLPGDAVKRVEAVQQALGTGQPARDAMMVCLPLTAPGRVLGTICVEGALPDQDALADLQVLAAHASLALENAVLFTALRRRSGELETILERYLEAEHDAQTDPLTGLANKRYFREQGRREEAIARRYKRPLSLLIADIDHFKKINDTYGHLTGDAALKAVSNTLSKCLRGSDLIARWGGEEFVVLSPTTNQHEARGLAERLRQAIERLEGTDEAGNPLPRITISLGVAEFKETDEQLDAALDRADRALLAAKEAGRNRVMVAD